MKPYLFSYYWSTARVKYKLVYAMDDVEARKLLVKNLSSDGRTPFIVLETIF